jgi:hypothetical protein
MIKKFLPALQIITLACLFTSCASKINSANQAAATNLASASAPKAMKEFRAAWVATVERLEVVYYKTRSLLKVLQ